MAPDQVSPLQAPAASDASVARQSSSKAHRRWKVWVCFLVGIVIATLLHPLWLPLLAWPLLAPVPKGLQTTELVWVHTSDGHNLAGDTTFPTLRTLLQDHPERMVIFTEGWPSRLVEIGVIPPVVETLRKHLAAGGISPERVVALHVTGSGLWNEAKALDAYLAQHPDKRVVFIVEEFAGRSTWTVLKAAMLPDSISRLDILGVPDRNFTTSNWWRTRAGVKGLMVGYLYLTYTTFWPKPSSPPRRLTLAELEAVVPPAPDGGAP